MGLAYPKCMGNPLRFYGTGESFVIDGVTVPARCVVEVTFRVTHQQFLLRPDKATNNLVKACFARALQRYPKLDLHVLNVLSNHGSFLATPNSSSVLSDFMRDFKSTLGRKLNQKHDRDGMVWERRFRAIPVMDEAMLDDRFCYILTQGTKENLVYNAKHWPGVTSIRTLLGGRPLVGSWRDSELEYERKRQRRRKLERAVARDKQIKLPVVPAKWIEYEIPHKPLPHWQQLAPSERQTRIARILSVDEASTRDRHKRDGTSPLGVARVLRVDPFTRPAESKNSPAPLCHASAPKLRRAFTKAYRLYVTVVRSSTDVLRQAATAACIPSGVILPPMFLSRAIAPSSGTVSTGPPN